MEKRALMVIDAQNFIVKKGDFDEIIDKIKTLIADFEKSPNEVIFIQNITFDNPSDSFYCEKRENIGLYIDPGNHKVFPKSKCNAFTNPMLVQYLRQHSIGHVVITGFNTEFSCMFTAIGADHEGFKVTFIEDACGSIADDETYETPGLNLNNFIGTVLDWSGCVEVLYSDQYTNENEDEQEV